MQQVFFKDDLRDSFLWNIDERKLINMILSVLCVYKCSTSSRIELSVKQGIKKWIRSSSSMRTSGGDWRNRKVKKCSFVERIVRYICCSHWPSRLGKYYTIITEVMNRNNNDDLHCLYLEGNIVCKCSAITVQMCHICEKYLAKTNNSYPKMKYICSAE